VIQDGLACAHRSRVPSLNRGECPGKQQSGQGANAGALSGWVKLNHGPAAGILGARGQLARV